MLSAKCPGCRRNVRRRNVCRGNVCRRNVRSAKCVTAECLSAKIPSTSGSYKNFKVAMNPDLFILRHSKLICSYTCTTFDALSNETRLSFLTAIVWEIITFLAFLIIQLFKNLKIAIPPEMLIAQYLMFRRFYRLFEATSNYFFRAR